MRLPLPAIALFALIGCSKEEPPPSSDLEKPKQITASSNEQQLQEAGDDLLEAKDLQIAHKVSEIPSACKAAFEGADFDDDKSLADPPEDGKHDRPEPKLQGKRLIYAGANQRSCFVYFRKGTTVPYYHLQLFHLGPPPTIAYHGVDANKVYPELASLRKAIMKNAFSRMTGPEKLTTKKK